MSEERCGNCRFYRSEGEKEGTCNRFPPHPDQRQNEFENDIFPAVTTGSWCGEWSKRKDADEDV